MSEKIRAIYGTPLAYGKAYSTVKSLVEKILENNPSGGTIEIMPSLEFQRLEARIQKLRDAAERLGKAVSMGNREQVICTSIELREALRQDDEQMNPSKPHLEGNI